jgi:hypothetical protein
MASATEGNYAGGFIINDECEHSRDAATVLSGQTITCGEVVGRVDKGVGGLAIPTVVGTGNGTMTVLKAGPDVQIGNYVLTCTVAAANAGTFSVVAPDATALPSATVGTAYNTSHVSFLLNDGSTDFIVGDVFTIAVAASTTATVVGTGNGTATAITLGPDAKPGTYIVEVTGAVTNGGVVAITGPDGNVIAASSITAGASGTLVVTSRQVNVTITDGSTDFAKGDTFRIVVFNQVTKKVVEWDPRPTSYDGRQIVWGVAYDAYDASAADVANCVFERRRAVVNGSELAFKSTVSAAEKVSAKAALTAMGVVVR